MDDIDRHILHLRRQEAIGDIKRTLLVAVLGIALILASGIGVAVHAWT